MKSLTHLFDLSGKTAIVTGASYGLGVTFAQTLSAAGANLVLAARSTDRLQTVSQGITSAGGTAIALACDVSDPAQVETVAEKAKERFGRVDILVNNAGVASDGGVMPEQMPNELFEQTVRVNLMGLWYCCRAVGKLMLSDGKGGTIINIASIAGLSGLKDFPVAYQATKAAVINLTRNLACSWADRKVRVNAIAPGWFPSEMTASWLAIPAFREWTRKVTPMRRTGEPEELAGPLLFLASEASSFVTGHTLVVDGGVSASAGASPWPDEFYQLLANAMPGNLGKPIQPS
jgi:NAD(P)-dependent dehydrogenase (short-subunit alcohol dehydrogenase family)